MIEENRIFWARHPAVLIGLSFLIGLSVVLFALPIWICAFWMGYIAWMKKWAAFVILPSAALYAYLLFGQLPQLEYPKQVSGYFSISTVQINKTPFQQNTLYKGTLFVEGAPIPCAISVHGSDRNPASCDYIVSGSLMQRGTYDYFLKAKSWQKVPRTWSLAEWRYKAKSQVRKYIHAHLSSSRSATLLSSLVTGEVDDRLLRYEFSRLGLQHILAISGFHFGVLIAFISLLLRFLPNRYQWLTMLILTTTYYLFVGDSPSVQRAWIIVSLFLIAKLIGKPTTPINLLGTALLIELTYHPLVAANLGFQFSFGSCFGILLLYRPIERALQKFFPVRRAREAATLPAFQGFIYLLCGSMRSAMALTTAVNATLLPLLFYHFSKFPMLSLIYNLFFPFLISLALFLLLAALLFSAFAAFLARPLFAILDFFTKQLLDLISYPPLLLDHCIYIREIRYEFIAIYLFGLIQLSIYLHRRKDELISSNGRI
jgi:competence protein ComEC